MKKIVKRALVSYLTKKGFKRINLNKQSAIRAQITSLIASLRPLQSATELIRLGPKGDGGYLVPDNLNGIEACFSPGVDMISEFELNCIQRKMKVFMADKSVEKPNLNLPEDQYGFIKKYIGCTNNENFITMDHWVSNSPISKSSDLLLQMDIEGAEYQTFINMSDALIKRFRIMVIEFHFLQKLWVPEFLDLAQIVFDKILQTHYCIHIHPNNCCGLESQLGIDIPRVAEFTFIRKEYLPDIKYAVQFPHPLDFDNTSKPTLHLPDCWYKN